MLLKLRIFTETHFAYEETVLRLIGFPGLDRHKAMHESMGVKTQEVIADLSRSNDGVALLHFLREWWLGHVQGADRHYIPYLAGLDL